jgi:hypothetical protein
MIDLKPKRQLVIVKRDGCETQTLKARHPHSVFLALRVCEVPAVVVSRPKPSFFILSYQPSEQVQSITQAFSNLNTSHNVRFLEA